MTQIAIVSDTHFDANDRLLVNNWRAVERWLKANAPDLVFHLGDVTAKGSTDGAQLTFARDLLASSKIAIQTIPGNHDIGDCPVTIGELPADPLVPARMADFQRLFGPDRWHLKAGMWRLIGLNALVLGTGIAEEESQFAWLQQTLGTDEGPIGLFLHKPLFRDDPGEEIAHVRYPAKPARQRLLSILSGHDVRFVAAGHTHQMRRHYHAGIEHVWVPSTAFTVPDSRQERIGEKRVGIMTLELDADQHRFAFVAPHGLIPHSLMDFPHIYPALAALREQPGFGDG